MKETMMESLQRSRLAAGSYGVAHTPGAPVYPVNILQIGDGNFLRAFVDWMVDVCNGQGLFRGGVAIAQPLPQGIAGQRGGGINHRRGADGEKNIAGGAGGRGAFHRRFGQLFFKPDHVRPQQPAAVRAFGRHVPGVRPACDHHVFIKAFRAGDVAVQLDDLPAAGPLVQAVNVLGDEVKFGKEFLHLGERQMRGVRPGFGHELAQPGVPFPHQAGIAAEGARRGQFFGIVFGPQTGLRRAKGRHTAFHRHARAGQHRHAPRPRKLPDQIFGDRHVGNHARVERIRTSTIIPTRFPRGAS